MIKLFTSVCLILILNHYTYAENSQTKSDTTTYKYRISGLLMATEYDGFRASVITDALREWLEGDLSYKFRHMQAIFARSELFGSVQLALPETTIGNTSVTVWQKSYDDRENTSYLNQKYFEFDIETTEKVPLTWQPGFNCSVTENDDQSENDTVCDSNQTYSVLPPNSIMFKLASSTRGINTLTQLATAGVDVATVCKDVGFFDSACTQIAGQFLKDISGLWIYNFQIKEITQAQSYYRVKGRVAWNTSNISEEGIEPYGQIILVPDARFFDLSAWIEGAAFPQFDGRTYTVFERELTRSTMRSMPRGHGVYFDKYINTDANLNESIKVFVNTWEKDNSGVNPDDCYSRGVKFGVDQGSPDGFNLTECNDDHHNRVSLSGLSVEQITPGASEKLYELDGYLYFKLGDGGDPIEPYGSLYVDIPSPGNHQSRLIWKDSYKDSQGSDDLPDNQTHFPFTIRFHSYELNELNSKNMMIHGSLYESDTTSGGDDRYFDSSESGAFSVNIGSNTNGYEIELPRSAKHDQKAYISFKLKAIDP